MFASRGRRLGRVRGLFALFRFAMSRRQSDKPSDDQDPNAGKACDNKSDDKNVQAEKPVVKKDAPCNNDTASIINQLAALADSIHRASSTAASSNAPSSIHSLADNLKDIEDGVESFHYLRSLISTSPTSDANRDMPRLRRMRASSRLSLLTNIPPFSPVSPVHPTPRSPRYTAFPPLYKPPVPTRPKIRFSSDVSF